MGERHCFAFQEPRYEDARGGAAGGTKICGGEYALIEWYL